MNLLAIDTATSACSAALWLNDSLGPSRCAFMQRGHAEALMPMVADIMAESGTGFADLQAIAVTTGPGAFTGIRIGLSAGRGFALASGLPLMGVTTLEAVAAAQDAGGTKLLVALDSKREDIYVQLFTADGLPAGIPVARLPEDIGALLPAGEPVAVAGDMADAVLNANAGRNPGLLRTSGPRFPEAAMVAQIAAARFAESPPEPNGPPPTALYLRPPDAVPKAGRK